MDASAAPSQLIRQAQQELLRRRAREGVTYCPAPDTAVVDTSWLQELSAACAAAPPPARTNAALPEHARIAPTLAAHCLDKTQRHNGAPLDGPYRLYKVLQALDTDGRGWLASGTVEAALTRKDSATHLYGRRRLKTMLRRGEGLFWRRVKHGETVRIRLVARAKVVHALGLGRLRGGEVALPLAYLLGGGRGRQAAVNAALYTAVHAGRTRDGRRAGPISRARLAELSGCSPGRQRRYEQRMDVRVQANIRILGPHSDYALGRAQEHLGLRAYKHIDYRGRIDRHRPGRAYVAARLPNSYQAPGTITVLHSRRQQTMNRHLDGLCPMGSGGSDRPAIRRLFHRDGATAVRAFNRDPQQDVFWPLAAAASTRLWQTLGA